MEKRNYSREELILYQKLSSAEFKREQEEAVSVVRSLLYEWNQEEIMRAGKYVIRSISSRIKSPGSILEKMRKKKYEMDYNKGVKLLNDLAGVRAVCFYMEDIYALRERILACDRVKVVTEKDYIRSPKKTGYQSLHFILETEVGSFGEKRRVELQIRTVAMDYWWDLEHKMVYKKGERVERMLLELKKEEAVS